MVNAPLRRRAFTLAGTGLALGLGGCAAVDGAQPVATPPGGAGGTGGAILSHWLSLTGGWRIDPQQPPQVAKLLGGRSDFVQPVGVAARNGVLLVADSGARTLWRVERARDAMAPFTTFRGGVADAGASMQLGSDFSAWVALPAERVVVQYDARGRIVRRWANEVDAPRPVAVAVPEDRSRVLVGDSATAQVLVFDPLGQIQGRLGGRQPLPLQSIAAMALGPRGLYVLDRLAQQVMVFDPRGGLVEVLAEHQLVQPRALAVDGSGRVFVSDEADQTIKVFRGEELLGVVGGRGAGPSRFGRIESMALDGNLLYVADSQNARVQVLMVAPPSMEAPAERRR